MGDWIDLDEDAHQALAGLLAALRACDELTVAERNLVLHLSRASAQGRWNVNLDGFLPRLREIARKYGVDHCAEECRTLRGGIKA